MRLLLACLIARKEREISLYHCLGPVKLVQACLCAGRTLQHRFNRRGGALKHVQAFLSASKDRENSFHHAPSMSCEARASLFMCGKYHTTLF